MIRPFIRRTESSPFAYKRKKRGTHTCCTSVHIRLYTNSTGCQICIYPCGCICEDMPYPCRVGCCPYPGEGEVGLVGAQPQEVGGGGWGDRTNGFPDLVDRQRGPPLMEGLQGTGLDKAAGRSVHDEPGRGPPAS